MNALRRRSIVSAAVTLALVSLIDRPASGRQSGAAETSRRDDVSCRDDQRGRLLRYEHVASYPTADAARAYFYEWIAFYQGFYNFPEDLPARFTYGFDSYKVTYCTVDAVLPGQRTGANGRHRNV